MPEISMPETTAHTRERIPWAILLLVTGAFLIIEHDWAAARKFELLTSAQSLSEFTNLEQQLFQPRVWRQAGGLALGIFGLYSILRRRKPAQIALGFLGGLLVFFFAWMAMSLLWSDDRGLTARRLVLLGLLSLGAAGVTDRLSLRQILWLVVLWTGANLAVGVAAEVVQGTFTPLTAGYRFAGTVHPNAQAINCAILFLAGLHLLRGLRRGHLLVLLLLVAAFGFMYLTRSRTAVASVIAVLFMQWGILKARSTKVALASGALMFAILALILSNVIWPVAQRGIMMGRLDSGETTGTLTGRRQLWDQCMDFAGERPVLGYGYGAFWNPARSNEIIEKQEWIISHAHNAYLDVLLEAGPVAAATYLLIIVVGITLAFHALRTTGLTPYAFFASLLLFCALNGLLESVVVQRSELTFLALVALIQLAFHRLPADRRAAEPTALTVPGPSPA